MGYAVHQVLVYGPPNAVIAFRHGLSSRGSCVMVYRHRAVHSPFDQFLGLVDAVGHRDHDNRLSVKSGHLHVLIRCNDNGIRRCNFFPCEHILGSAGTVGLSFQGNSQLLSRILQVLSRHVGVGNAGGTGRNRQNTVTGGGACFCIRLCILGRLSLRRSKTLCLCLIYDA